MAKTSHTVTSTSSLKEFFKYTDKKCPKHHIRLKVPVFGKDRSPFCQKCEDEKRDKQDNENVKKYTKIVKQQQTSKVLKSESIISDSDLEKATFNNYEPASDEARYNLNLARHIAGEYMLGDGQFNTLFTGLPGRGKSHLALSMLKGINEKSKTPMSCLFVSVDELIRRIKSSFDYPSSPYTESAMVDKLKSVDLLVMDDLGSESSFTGDKQATNFVQNILFGIFNGRNRTIITTNLNSKQLADTYNPKIISRMEHGVKGHIIKFTDKTPDHRLVIF